MTRVGGSPRRWACFPGAVGWRVLRGTISIRVLTALPFLVPLYFRGALLIREVTRRAGRGWPATGFGVVIGLSASLLFGGSSFGRLRLCGFGLTCLGVLSSQR
jgi:hypothetical protein